MSNYRAGDAGALVVPWKRFFATGDDISQWIESLYDCAFEHKTTYVNGHHKDTYDRDDCYLYNTKPEFSNHALTVENRLNTSWHGFHILERNCQNRARYVLTGIE